MLKKKRKLHIIHKVIKQEAENMSRVKKTGQGKYKYFTETFVGPDGKRHVVRSKSNKGFNELVEAKKTEVFEVAKPKTITPMFFDWTKDFIGNKTKKRKSYITLLSMFNENYIKPNDKPLHEITTMDVESILKQAVGKSRAESTVYQIFLLLNSSLKSAVKKKIILENPADNIDAKPSVTPKKIYDDIPKPIAQMILHEIKIIPALAHYSTIMEFFFKTGCRRGELAGLERKHYYFGEKRFSIEQSLNSDEHSLLYIGPPKSPTSERDIWLSDEMNIQVQDILSNPNRKLWIDSNKKSHDFIFQKPDGTPFVPRTLTQLIRRLCDKLANSLNDENNTQNAEIMGNIHLHSTRHYCFSKMSQQPGVTLPDIRDMAGHRDFTTTNRYIGKTKNSHLGNIAQSII